MTANAHPRSVDGELLSAARRGDMKAREALFRQFEKPVYTLALRICRCPDEAFDLLQDTFVQAFGHLDQYQGNAPFWGWLRRVAVNLCISRMRRLRRLDLREVEESSHEPDPGDELDLADAFARLPAETRTVLWLYDVEGYSHQEIAELFGRSTSFSKTQVSRGRQRLRDWLEPGMEDSSCPKLIETL